MESGAWPIKAQKGLLSLQKQEGVMELQGWWRSGANISVCKCVCVCVWVWCRAFVSVPAQQQGARRRGGAAGVIREPPQRAAPPPSISPRWRLSCGVKTDLQLPYCLWDPHIRHGGEKMSRGSRSFCIQPCLDAWQKQNETGKNEWS